MRQICCIYSNPMKDILVKYCIRRCPGSTAGNIYLRNLLLTKVGFPLHRWQWFEHRAVQKYPRKPVSAAWLFFAHSQGYRMGFHTIYWQRCRRRRQIKLSRHYYCHAITERHTHVRHKPTCNMQSISSARVPVSLRPCHSTTVVARWTDCSEWAHHYLLSPSTYLQRTNGIQQAS